MPDLLHKDEAYQIIGAAMEVHKELGHGFLEAVYQEALAIEFQKKVIPFEKEKLLNIYYKDVKLNKYYSADFICYKNIVVELKAIKELSNNDQSQAINYLKATGFELAILINFGSTSLQYKRIVLSQ